MDSDFGAFGGGNGRSAGYLSRVKIIEGENMRVKDLNNKVWVVVERSGIPFNCLVEL